MLFFSVQGWFASSSRQWKNFFLISFGVKVHCKRCWLLLCFAKKKKSELCVTQTMLFTLMFFFSFVFIARLVFLPIKILYCNDIDAIYLFLNFVFFQKLLWSSVNFLFLDFGQSLVVFYLDVYLYQKPNGLFLKFCHFFWKWTFSIFAGHLNQYDGRLFSNCLYLIILHLPCFPLFLVFIFKGAGIFFKY